MVKQQQNGKPTSPAMDYDYAHITTSDTGLVNETGAITLHVVTINDAGTNWIITVYDSGNESQDIPENIVAVIPAVQGTFGYNASLVNGLRVTTAGTPGDATIVFR